MAKFPPGAPLYGRVARPCPAASVILIAIGANLAAADGRSAYHLCNDAVDALSALPGTFLASRSRWYRSAPVPASDQPDYVNGVVRLEATPGLAEPDPATLLALLQRIELEHGRERSVANAPRTLDLDIIAMGATGSLVRDAPDPVLPHPRAHLRAFVLLPLQEVAPEWVEPRMRVSISDLITRLPPAELEPESLSALLTKPETAAFDRNGRTTGPIS